MEADLEGLDRPIALRYSCGMSRGTQLLAVAIGVLPVHTFAIVSHLVKDDAYSIREMMLYPLIVGGGSIVLLLALLRFTCREPLSALNPGKGRWWTDVLVAVPLTVVYFLVGFGVQAAVGAFVPRTEPTPEIIVLLEGLARSPALLAMWLGPVVWIGIALFEELSRVFMLGRLWNVWPSAAARHLVVLFSAALMGLAHIYQGHLGVLSIAALALIKGWYFMRFGRFWPLVISHALFDSIQIVMAVRLF